MDIVLVTGAFPLRSQSFVVGKAVGLAARGHRVTVVAGGPGDHHLDPLVTRRLGPRLRVEQRGASRWERALAAAQATGRDPRFAGRLATEVLRRHGVGRASARRLERGLSLAGRRADIVHFEWATAAARCSEALDLVGSPTVVSCRGSDVSIMAPADPRLAAELGRVFAGADAVHCVSEAVRGAAEGLGLPPSKAFVNHPAVDTDLFSPAPHPTPASAEVRVLSVGRLHPVKGYRDALEAVRQVVDQGHDVRYTVVGGGESSEAAALRRVAEGVGLDGRVVFAGAVAHEQVRDRMRASDVVLLASASEGLSNSVLEAMACAVPVVSTDVGGMAEAVRDGIEGYLVPAGDPAAMAAALGRLAADPALRSRMGARGRRRVCESFAVGPQLDRFEALYRRLAGA